MLKLNIMLYVISFLLGGAGAWSISRCGTKLSLLDKPNLRSSHKTVTPKGGGIGVLAAFFVCSIVLSIPKSFWITAILLSLFSFWGDRSEIRPKIRLLCHFVAGTILLIGVLIVKADGSAPYYLLIPLWAVFIVGTANFYNFMDGINGIASITGIVGFGLIAFYSFSSGYSASFSILAVCIVLACMGFLPFNVPKAKVFMGDVGSVLLGFVFAGLVVYLSKDVLDFICLSSFLFPFYVDELATMMVRLKEGENLTKPHRRHLYQLLANECNISHWKISVGYGLFQLMIGIGIILLKDMGLIMVISVLAFCICSFTIFSLIFRKKIHRFA